MRFYLYQMNGRLGDMAQNGQKLLHFVQSLPEDSCTLPPSLPLIHHPYTDLEYAGGFLERVQQYLLTEKETKAALVYESLSLSGQNEWKCLGNASCQENMLQIGSISVFAPHCPAEDFQQFLNKLQVPRQCSLVYLAAAHRFYDGFDVRGILAEFAKKHQKTVAYVNACGASDGTVFAGKSMVFDSKGIMLIQLEPFAEDSAYFDFDGQTIQAQVKTFPDHNADGLLFLAAKQALQDYSQKTGIKKAVIGLSGGMDSALVAAMTCEALGKENVTGIIMPSQYNSQASMDDANALSKNLGIKCHVIPISDITQSFENALAPSFSEQSPAGENDTTFENIQARTRGNLLTAFANRVGAMVVSTGNKSEAAMGYCTLYGDTVGAIEPIADIYKTRTYKVAAWYNESKKQEIIPHNIFVKAPTAELRPNQKDEDSLPPYAYLDEVLRQLLEEGKNPADITESHLSQEDIQLVWRRLKASEFKRKQCPFPVVLTVCPFGPKWNPCSCAKIF